MIRPHPGGDKVRAVWCELELGTSQQSRVEECVHENVGEEIAFTALHNA